MNAKGETALPALSSLLALPLRQELLNNIGRGSYFILEQRKVCCVVFIYCHMTFLTFQKDKKSVI